MSVGVGLNVRTGALFRPGATGRARLRTTGKHTGAPARSANRAGSVPRTVITLEDLREARARVAPVIRDTPLTRSGALGRLVGRPLWCKGEHLQRTGSYKIRGAYNRISRLDPATYSAGLISWS